MITLSRVLYLGRIGSTKLVLPKWHKYSILNRVIRVLNYSMVCAKKSFCSIKLFSDTDFDLTTNLNLRHMSVLSGWPRREPKPMSNFSIEIGAKMFICKTKTFKIFSCVPMLGDISFYKLKNKTKIFKNNLRISKLWQQIWF